MDIYLTEIGNNNASLTFPCLPESIKCSSASASQNYEIISKGNVTIPKGTQISTVSWSGTFFGQKRPLHSFIKNNNAPKTCKAILNRWLESGTPLKLLITDTNINYDVTIDSFSGEETGAHGDYTYSLTFSCIKELKVYTTDELKIEAYKKVSRPSPPTGGTYTVVSGDTLWGIAQTHLGSGTKWSEIYNLNADVIESSARKYGRNSSDNGHWIYPGDTYTLPV